MTPSCLHKSKKELETLIQAIRICSQGIGIEIGVEKCTLLIMKRGKGQITEGIRLLKRENIRTLGERETYK